MGRFHVQLFVGCCRAPCFMVVLSQKIRGIPRHGGTESDLPESEFRQVRSAEIDKFVV